MSTTLGPKPAVHYPDSDGQPMADNTLQFQWIVTLQGNLDLMFHDDPNVFVAGDHLIYPVEGDAELCLAPDVYVVFGRPKGNRGSYKVFEEGGIFPQVVFEVWSPHNRQQQMEDKREFYERYGAEEYYIVYPEFPAYLEGWRREGGRLLRVPDIRTWRSPRLGFRVEVKVGSLFIFRADGGRFLSFVELGALQQQTEKRAEEERLRAEQEAQRAEQEKRRAEQEAIRADQEKLRAEQERQRAEKLAARLRELGVDPDAP